MNLMVGSASLINELETTLRHGSSAQRADVLRRVTDLFLHRATSYSADHVTLFDDVMCRLVEKIERHALIRLSLQLAPVEQAPPKVVHHLAWSDDIAVSGPIIERSVLLTDEDLVELAKTKSQAHLAAIAVRRRVGEPVTEVLVDRGDSQVTRKVAANAGARVSKQAFLQVAGRAHEDEDLAEKIINRKDIPPDVFEYLVRKATEVVKQRLLRNATPEMRIRITRTLAAIADQIAKEAPQPEGDGYSVRTLKQLDVARLKSQLSEYARANKRSETIETLSTLSKLPADAVKSLLKQEAEDGVLILCKAIGLGWPDVKSVLAVMMGTPGENAVDLKSAFDKYINLTDTTANRVIRFVKSCKAVSKADLQRML